MIRCPLLVLAVLLELGICTVPAQSNDVPLVQRRWFETRTAHFNIYSCGAPQDVYKLSARLEQFCEAYTLLTVAQAVKVDNDLYVRDYSKCILCYKCVEACGEDHQNTFAIAVAGRGFGAHISTELDVELPESACVYCGNCVAVCPTGALMAKSEFDLRQTGTWDESRQEQVDTICPYCGVGCNLTLHVQDGGIVKVSSPDDHDVTRGNLCVKGRFGYAFVQNRPRRS